MKVFLKRTLIITLNVISHELNFIVFSIYFKELTKFIDKSIVVKVFKAFV